MNLGAVLSLESGTGIGTEKSGKEVAPPEVRGSRIPLSNDSQGEICCSSLQKHASAIMVKVQYKLMNEKRNDKRKNNSFLEYKKAKIRFNLFSFDFFYKLSILCILRIANSIFSIMHLCKLTEVFF